MVSPVTRRLSTAWPPPGQERRVPRLEDEPFDDQAVAGGAAGVRVGDDDRRGEQVHERQRLDGGQHGLFTARALAGRAAVGVERHDERAVQRDVGDVHDQREVVERVRRGSDGALIRASRDDDRDAARAGEGLAGRGTARGSGGERAADGGEVRAVGRRFAFVAHEQGGEIVAVRQMSGEARGADLDDPAVLGGAMADLDLPGGGRERRRRRRTGGGRDGGQVRSTGCQKAAPATAAAARQGA